MWRGTAWVAAALVAGSLAGPASAQAYDETQNWLNAFGRTVEKVPDAPHGLQVALRSAEAVLETAQRAGRVPDRGAQQTGAWPWSGDVDRGTYGDPASVPGVSKVELEFDNRKGQALKATAWAPTRARVKQLGFKEPLPGVVYSGGVLSAEPMYYWFAETMARAGYVVLTYDVSGQGRSEGSSTGNAPEDLEDALKFFFSDDMPFAGRLDERRVGTAGHSMGAGAVQTVGSFGGKVKAISAQSDLRPTYKWDVPIQGQGADYENFIFPPQPTPDVGPSSRGKLAGHDAVAKRGVDVQEVVIESGTHLAWSHVSWAYTSTWSEAVAAWYSLAWFDRYLHGDVRRRDGEVRADGETGTARLTRDFDAVGDHGLSAKYTSAWTLGGVACADMTKPCPKAASLEPKAKPRKAKRAKKAKKRSTAKRAAGRKADRARR
jgi:hypothetical protein